MADLVQTVNLVEDREGGLTRREGVVHEEAAIRGQDRGPERVGGVGGSTTVGVEREGLRVDRHWGATGVSGMLRLRLRRNTRFTGSLRSLGVE